MNDHLSNSQIILFQARALPSAEMMAALEHLTQCIHCRQRNHEHSQANNAYQSSTITLSPAFQWQHEHLDAEQITSFVNKSLDKEDEKIAQAHLQTCKDCRAEIQDKLSFQEELQIDLRTRYGPKPTPKQLWQWKPLWPGWGWKPIFATLFIVACVLATILVLRDQANRKAISPMMAAGPSPTTSVITPSPSASITTPKPPTEAGPEETVIASLRDRRGIISLTSTGDLEGISSKTDELRDGIVAALRTGKLNKPTILNDLAGDGGTMRGKASNEAPSELLTPIGITILATRPVLHWRSVEKASGYEVQIADGRGNEVAHSEILPTTINHWQPPQALKRGAIYTWTVRAIHEEPTAMSTLPTGRFKVLEAAKAQELSRLKAKADSHLVLGMFYAHAGMLPEAKQELKLLANKNPGSRLARKLLQTVQVWH